METILEAYNDSLRFLKEFIEDEANIKNTKLAAEIIAESFNQGNKVIIAGNGGSTCDAMHFAEEFTGRFRSNRKPLPAISISDPSHITCVGNDYGFEHIFSRGVQAYGKSGDVFIGISTSGNSKNIINAVNQAKNSNMKTISLLGKTGGELKNNCDIEFIIPAKTSDRIQEIHMMILHIIIEHVERILFPELY